MAAPIGAVLGPSHMDPGEEACTAACSDHIIERLQSLEAADQLHKRLSTFAAELSTVWLKILQPSDMADSFRFPLWESATCSLR